MLERMCPIQFMVRIKACQMLVCMCLEASVEPNNALNGFHSTMHECCTTRCPHSSEAHHMEKRPKKATQKRQRTLRSLDRLLRSMWIVLVFLSFFPWHVLTSPAFGEFTALIVLVQFPDHRNRLLPERSYLQNLCDTRISDYLYQQSYGNYKLSACHVQEWLITNATEAFFAGGVGNRKSPEEAAAFAIHVLDQLDESGLDWSVYDKDGDGALDAVIFLHSGWAAERGNGDCEGGRAPQDRLQSMAGPDSNAPWRSATNTTIHLSGYGIASAYDDVCSTKPALMGVWAHEFMHLFATPDLYDPNKFNGGLGHFDIMSNPEGAVPGYVPGSASPYTKIQIGWMEPTEILYDGRYTLRTSNLHPDCFIIRKGYGLDEYLLIENRFLINYDEQLPGKGGLLIYHIDELQEYFQEFPGWPGFDSNWPYDHYAVALLQQDGNYDLEKGINSGDGGDFYTNDSRGLLPGYATFHPSSDSYQFGQITSTNISIIDISEPGMEVSFTVTGLGPDPSKETDGSDTGGSFTGDSVDPNSSDDTLKDTSSVVPIYVSHTWAIALCSLVFVWCNH